MNLDTWRWFFSHLKPHRKYITTLILVSLAFGLIGIATPLTLQRLIDTAVAGTIDTTLMAILISLFVVASIPLPNWMRNRLQARFIYKLRGDLLHSLLRMDISFHDNRGSTKLTAETGKGVGAARDLLNLFTGSQIFLQFPMAIYAIYYLGKHSLLALSILIAYLIAFSICAKVLGTRISAETERHNAIDNELTQRSREAVQLIQTVKLNGTTNQELGYYWKEGKLALDSRFKLINLHILSGFWGSGANDFAVAIVLIFFIPQVVQGDITVGTFFALVMFATRIVEPAEFLGKFYAEIKEASALLKPVMKILANEPAVVEQLNPLKLNKIRNEVSLKNVSFKYPGSNRLILKEVSLTFRAGQKTAIVGKTGSGKSTLARLLTRLYDPTIGVIEYDGTDLRNVSFGSLYGEVSYLTQEVPIFTGTVEDNVAYGLETCQPGDVNLALTRASALFVHQFENGIHTEVGELGKNLSGGERQRIAITRIFMRNPSVVILDEATSALDNKTEREVHQAFEKLGSLDEGKTMIVIAHRLSTVLNADQIIVMDDGRVLDVGRHEELLERCDLYRQLALKNR